METLSSKVSKSHEVVLLFCLFVFVVVFKSCTLLQIGLTHFTPISSIYRLSFAHPKRHLLSCLLFASSYSNEGDSISLCFDVCVSDD